MNNKDTSTPLETDWDRLDKMTDDEIDYSDIPRLDDKFFANARVYVPPSKRENFIQLDEGVLSWYKSQSKEYQGLINEVLRKYIETQGTQHLKVAEAVAEYHIEKALMANQFAAEGELEMATMEMAVDKVHHPYIERKEGVCRGKPKIVGTRIKVSNIVMAYERMGWTPDQIVDQYPHLRLEQVHDALSYYYENQTEIDAEILDDERFVEEMKKKYPSKLRARLQNKYAD